VALIGQDISQAKRLLEQADVIGIPTETVYGLAGNALSEAAVLNIFKVKNRPYFDPLICHTDSLEKIKLWVEEIPDAALHLAKVFWPGPLTILLRKKSIIPDLVTSGSDLVAFRIPAHPLTLELLKSLDFPLAAPSANPFGYISPTTAQHVNDQLGEQIPYILDGGKCKVGIESTIIGFDGPEATVYRLGGKSIEEIEKIVGKVKLTSHSSSNPQAPGMLKSHYAPTVKFRLGNIEQMLEEYDPAEVGILSLDSFFDEVPSTQQIKLSSKASLDEAAGALFSAMRKLDTMPIKIILAEPMPNEGLGRAMNDRLKRAAAE